MSLPQLDESILVALTLLLMATLVAVLGLWVWAIPRLIRGVPLLSPVPILPLQPARWGGLTVFAVILLYIGANIVTGIGYGAATQGRRPAPEPEPEHAAVPVEAKETPAGPAAGADDKAADEPDDEEAKPQAPYSHRTALILNAIASLIFLIFLPTVLYPAAGVTPAELGFSWKDWRRQIQVGKIAALLTVPVVYAVQALSVQIWEVREHPVQQMMADQLSPASAVLALLTTIILAPLVEETLFRGILLGWLTRLLSEAPPPPATSPTPRPLLIKESAARAAEAHTETNPIPAILTESHPAEAMVASTEPTPPNHVCLPAIIVASLLFAGMHASQWPAPVGIFCLSMVLGVVYQRTGSLLTAMVAHGVFNGCSTLLLLQGLLARSIQDAGPKAPEIAPHLQPALQALAECWSWCF